jgi:hypothetical protein
MYMKYIRRAQLKRTRSVLRITKGFESPLNSASKECLPNSGAMSQVRIVDINRLGIRVVLIKVASSKTPMIRYDWSSDLVQRFLTTRPKLFDWPRPVTEGQMLNMARFPAVRPGVSLNEAASNIRTVRAA